jgi:E3 ubiquitin-protein ligase BRE1
MEIERSRSAARDESLLSSGTDEENTMLDITLNMLRCSVCKDRFKEVAITRCFHLFCKECIDENLRNRSRKCPACGEKFGQDDVKQVYFTS